MVSTTSGASICLSFPEPRACAIDAPVSLETLTLPARCLVEGEAEGRLSLWFLPLSFWGGFDSETGRVVDRSHPAYGEVLTGRILAMPSGRGSSSASSVLAEAIRRGTAPAAIILKAPDPIIVVGALVAQRLYGRVCPVLVCAARDFDRLVDGARLSIGAQTRHGTTGQGAD